MSDQQAKTVEALELILDRTFADIDRLERLLAALEGQETHEETRQLTAGAFRALHLDQGTEAGLAADDAQLLTDVRVNAERLLSTLSRLLIDLTMSGSIDAGRIEGIARRARAAMEAFSAAPAAAPENRAQSSPAVPGP